MSTFGEKTDRALIGIGTFFDIRGLPRLISETLLCLGLVAGVLWLFVVILRFPPDWSDFRNIIGAAVAIPILGANLVAAIGRWWGFIKLRATLNGRGF